MRQIKESDWKIFRELHVVALERFCRRILDEVAAIVANGNETGSAHSHYLELYNLVKRRDREMANAFDELRRSTALLQLRIICAHGLLTPDEFARFSEETREVIKLY